MTVRKWEGPDWRIECGDCLDLLKSLPSGSVKMIFTDPPYGHSNQNGDLQSARKRDRVAGGSLLPEQPIANDTPEEFRSVMVGFLDEAARVLAPDCCCCCCCCGGGGPSPTFAWVADAIDARLAFFHAVVWDKTARGPGMGWRYRRDYEFVMVAHRKGGTLSWSRDGAASNIMRNAPPRDREHPNQKPVELVREFLLNHTEPGDTVLDPFMGSGTTGVACIQTGRKFIGFELDAKYCEIAARRIGEVGELFRQPKGEAQ
jgi:site-specific DNA-methyltransferase (adenine-specific)